MTETPKTTSERISSASLFIGGAALGLPPPMRHHDVLAHARGLGFTVREIAEAPQGFTTTTGRFVDRKAAWPIADAAGQITRLPGGVDGLLFSENLW